MSTRVMAVSVALVAVFTSSPALAQTWNSPGMTNEEFQKQGPGGPAPKRDLTGVWDAGGAGIGGSGQADQREAARAPYTPLGEQMMQRNKPGNGPRTARVAEINDPLSTKGDPTGFPRILTFELRPVQIAQLPDQVVMLYMFEKRYRIVWTDGRPLPSDPDPRWYGYSVGRWEDDYTFVVTSVGMDERTWIDNSGNPHSENLKVEERYHRVSQNVLELTVTIDDPTIYTKPWLARNKLPLKLMPGKPDMMEMVPSASEALAYRDSISSQTK